MDQEDRESLKKATELAQARAPKGTVLSHVTWRDGHVEAGYTRAVPKEGLELIAAKAELPPGLQPRQPKRPVKRGIQEQLDL